MRHSYLLLSCRVQGGHGRFRVLARTTAPERRSSGQGPKSGWTEPMTGRRQMPAFRMVLLCPYSLLVADPPGSEVERRTTLDPAGAPQWACLCQKMRNRFAC